MTELEKQRYNRDLGLYQYQKANPKATYYEIGKLFNISESTARTGVFRMHAHLNCGEDYIKPRSKGKRGKYRCGSRALNKAVKNVDEVWKEKLKQAGHI